MATNYRYSTTSAQPLKVQDLEVGDRLVQALWSHNPAKWVEVIWTVKKVLKTRLVISREVIRNGERIAIEKRVLVDNDPSWAYTFGNVKDRVEGQSEWSRDNVWLFTPDDALLVSLREKLADAAAKQRVRAAAWQAAKKITDTSRRFTEAEALEAIAALQAFIETKKETQ